MWWNRPFYQGLSQPSTEFFKLQEGGKEAQAPYNSSSCEEGSWNFNPGSGYCDRRGTDPRGWARTGLEPETLVYLNFVPFDAILDVGSNISTVDVTVSEYLKIPIRPFVCNLILSSGIEGALMTKTHVAVMGWIEVEVGILGLGCILARFWVTDCSYDRCVPVVLGSHQIKKVMASCIVLWIIAISGVGEYTVLTDKLPDSGDNGLEASLLLGSLLA